MTAPTFRHIVLLELKPDTTDAQRDAVVEALRALPAQIPELLSYVVGVDAGISPGNAHIAVVADFASADDFPTYRDHPAHQTVITEQILPLLAGRSAVQHER